METPPRAWGRRHVVAQPVLIVGNTPTGVGTTLGQALERMRAEKHPHGRGDDSRSDSISTTGRETPPRAWGRPTTPELPLGVAGNTPTGVGTTTGFSHGSGRRRKHPHGRGDDGGIQPREAEAVETPPRAWGRRSTVRWCCPSSGNTPTGVGTTQANTGLAVHRQKHPHGRGDDTSLVTVWTRWPETPPRAWGRPDGLTAIAQITGNTPTGVGTTASAALPPSWPQKHPHGRGDDAHRPYPTGAQAETPPRAWGRPKDRRAELNARGNTPTGVGTTLENLSLYWQQGKHPHGRGDDGETARWSTVSAETPPRAWGRRAHRRRRALLHGNTPTGVGTTIWLMAKPLYAQKHPHGRGDDDSLLGTGDSSPETPPRAWGRPSFVDTPTVHRGNTPTGVGTTGWYSSSRDSRRKHPHGRGDDVRTVVRWPEPLETPPRAWGRLDHRRGRGLLAGNTPTGVGTTRRGCRRAHRRWKHPHGRGDDGLPLCSGRKAGETPPRAWGRRSPRGAGWLLGRNTPTGVGTTRLRGCRCPPGWKHPHGRGDDA